MIKGIEPPKHPIIAGAFFAVLTGLVPVLFELARDQFQNRPVAMLLYGDWDAPVIAEEVGFPFDDYGLSEAHKKEGLDYLTIFIRNNGSSPIRDVRIKLDFDADFVIFGTGDSAQTFQNVREIPEFDLNPDQNTSVKIIDSIFLERPITNALQSSSSEGKLKIQHIVGLKPTSPIDPIFILGLLVLTGLYSLGFSAWLTNHYKKELEILRAQLNTKNTQH